MKKIVQSLLLLALLTAVAAQTFSASCPRGLQPLDLFSDSFCISSQPESQIQLDSGLDSHCFNYTLPSVFRNAIQVAVAINHFEVTRSNELFFSVVPLSTDNPALIPFQVRTPWKNTQWTKLTVNFLVESRMDIEAGFYQKDTGLVGACCQQRVQPVFLPFRLNWQNQRDLTVRVFLSGFEISTQPTKHGRSPYQLQLINTVYNDTGIIVQLSSTTSTQISNVYISYVVYNLKTVGITLLGGAVQLNTIKGGYTAPIVQNTITQFKYFIYGISGFSVNQGCSPQFDGSIDTAFTINLNFYGRTFNYIGFNYVVFSFNPCNTCKGYPVLYNQVCVQACPVDTIKMGFNCFQCPPNSFNDNGICNCKPGTYNISGQCTPCPLGQIWSGLQCVGCGDNARWIGNLCQCNEGFYNISGRCSLCPTGAHWDGYTCIGCGPNAYFFSGVCQCNPGFYNITGACQTCPPNTIFDGRACKIPCKPNQVWNGRKCENLCARIANSNWNGIQCVCIPGFFNVSGKCQNGNQLQNQLDWDNDRKNDDKPAPKPTPTPAPSGNACASGTYFDLQGQKCLPCSEGCANCNNCTECNTCGKGYVKGANLLCKEVCGDGMRFTVACDDGNNINGDGCSSLCTIEPGFTCSGGSPTHKDTCTVYSPLSTSLVQTGQTITGRNSVTVNVKLNWTPPGLVQKSGDCKQCNNILTVTMVSANSQASIVAQYIKGSSFSFAISFNFGNAPLSKFSFTVQINSGLQEPWFDGVDISQKLAITVDPASLSQATGVSGAK